jgi:hypothetical protein
MRRFNASSAGAEESPQAGPTLRQPLYAITGIPAMIHLSDPMPRENIMRGRQLLFGVPDTTNNLKQKPMIANGLLEPILHALSRPLD